MYEEQMSLFVRDDYKCTTNVVKVFKGEQKEASILIVLKLLLIYSM